MINSYSNVSKTFNANEVLTFTNNKILTGCTVTHTEGTGEFVLNKPGYYYVSFNANGSTSGTVGNMTVQLFNNGVAVPGAVATSYSGAVDQNENLSFSTIIRVLPSCRIVDNSVTLTVQNTGVEAVFNSLNIVITKLC